MSAKQSSPKLATVNTRFLATIAAVLVVNSHLEAYYPIPALAGDGLFGYALFFFISGLGLSLSSKNTIRSFGDYYWRRAARMYPTFWIVRIGASIHSQDVLAFTPLQFVKVFLWPTDNTFMGPLMAAYVPLYFVLRTQKIETIRSTMLAMFVPVAALWMYLAPEQRSMQSTSLWWLFAGLIHFQVMLFGSYLGFRARDERKSRFGVDTVLTTFVFVAYVATRILLQRGNIPVLASPVLFVFLATLCYLLFQISRSYELRAILERVPFVGSALAIVGAMSLELYFVQDQLIKWPALAQIVFPLNIVALWALLLPLAYALEKLTTWLRKRFLKVG